MAPASAATILTKRYYYNNCNYGEDCYSTWNSWGRWVALAVIVVVFFLLALLFSCFNSRRRRRRGLAPMYGTGWMGGKPPTGHQQYGHTNGYYPNQPYNGAAAPAPPYSPPTQNQTTGTAFNGGQGYYGDQGVEMQPPQNSYQPQRGGEPVYEAPQGPPPGKEGAVIR